MPEHLAKTTTSEPSPQRLDRVSVSFRMAIETSLEKRYCFDKINNNQGHKEFQRFIDETIGKNLSISKVDKLFGRPNDKCEKHTIGDTEFDVVHYGKDRKAFRVHGYYNINGYFVILKLDTNHNVHNGKNK